MMKVANRLNTVQEYYFSKKLREVRVLASEGKPIINMGIGSPDLQPPNEVIEAIKKAVDVEGAHKYQSYQGLPEFREAVADFYKANYEVEVSPNDEILPLMGSKEGILHISMAFLNKGDQVLIPNPGYPTYTSVTNLVEATPVFYELTSENNWEPDFEQLEKEDVSNIKMMWVNYPHMPTGAKATEALFEKLIAFGKKHQILIINDNPYSFIGNAHPTSILAETGGYPKVLELNSLSKVFNMAGWRVGALLGSKELLQSVLKVKSNMDSGMFFGIQRAAAKALAESASWFSQLNDVYMQRRKLVELLAKDLNLEVMPDQTGMFVWCRLPKGIKSEAFTDKLLEEYAIFCAPGFIFGSEGKRFVRFSLCLSADQIEKAIMRVKTGEL